MRFTFFRPLSSNVDSKIFTSLNDQDRKSPFNVDTISSRHVMRIKKNIHKNYMVDSKYYEIWGGKEGRFFYPLLLSVVSFNL